MTTFEQFLDDPDLDPLPVTGSRLVAQRRNVVRAIRISWKPQEEFDAALDEILYAAIDAPDGPQPGVRLLARSYAGKSTGARAYVKHVIARGEHPDGSIPVAYAKLDPAGDVGSIATDILRGLGARRPDSLTPSRRWERARKEMRDKGVRLFVFDEIQRAERRPTLGTVIGGKLLDIMDDENSPCACAFIGKQTKNSLFKSAPDLGNRLDAPVKMTPLLWGDDADKTKFTEFVDKFDAALKAGGATQVRSGLVDHAELLLEASNGLIGQFSRIIETAVMNITRLGADGITREDLATAVDDWSIGNERIGYNPFDRKGVALAQLVPTENGDGNPDHDEDVDVDVDMDVDQDVDVENDAAAEDDAA